MPPVSRAALSLCRRYHVPVSRAAVSLGRRYLSCIGGPDGRFDRRALSTRMPLVCTTRTGDTRRFRTDHRRSTRSGHVPGRAGMEARPEPSHQDPARRYRRVECLFSRSVDGRRAQLPPPCSLAAGFGRGPGLRRRLGDERGRAEPGRGGAGRGGWAKAGGAGGGGQPIWKTRLRSEPLRRPPAGPANGPLSWNCSRPAETVHGSGAGRPSMPLSAPFTGAQS